jgi:hypothetical protein
LQSGQVLQRRDERELNRLQRQQFALWCQRRRPREPALRIRLQRLQLQPSAPFDQREAPVRGDLVEPRTDRPAVVVPAQTAPRAQQRLLYCVLGVSVGTEHAIAVRVQLTTPRINQLSEGVLVTRACGIEQLSHHLHANE